MSPEQQQPTAVPCITLMPPHTGLVTAASRSRSLTSTPTSTGGSRTGDSGGSRCSDDEGSPLTSCPGSPRSKTARGYFPRDNAADSAAAAAASAAAPAAPCPASVTNVCFLGAGFVGGPTAAIVAYHNPRVTVNVVDLNEERVAAWNSRHLPIHEAGLPKIVRIARDGTSAVTADLPGLGTVSVPARHPNLAFSTRVRESLAVADIVFICVNTPTKLYGLGAGATADLSILESATTTIADYAKSGAIIVEKSTVPCGTARMIRDILEFHRPDGRFEILNNPEFLSEGCAVENLQHPDRILIGSARTPEGRTAAAKLKSVYATWVPAEKILTVNTWSSELTKLVANAMLAQRISSINAVSALCEELGADVEELSLGLGADSRLGPRFLHAGVGFGGSCFEKDILNLSYMARSLHQDAVADYWMGVLEINRYQRRRFASKVVRSLNGSLRGKKIAILGFGFKENTNDTRNSIAVHIIADLAAEMPMEIAVFDPGCSAAEVEAEIRAVGVTDAQMKRIHVRGHWRETVDRASAVCVLTQWDHFAYRAPGALPGSSAASTEDAATTKAVATAANDGSVAAAPPGSELPSASPKPVLDPEDTSWFLKTNMTEMDILKMEEFVVAQGPSSSGSSGDGDHFPATIDPLNRLVAERECRPDCTGCHARAGGMQDGETVDWEEVARLTREPRWVFDGRNVIDGPGLERLGFRVRGVGKGVVL